MRYALSFGLVASACFFADSRLFAAENVWSVESLNSRKTDWDQLIGATISVEGRLSLAGAGQLRLAKCEIPIHASEQQVKSILGRKAVEVTGRLKKENGKLFLDADRVQVVPTDVEHFESRYARLRNPKAADLFELGDWASQRGRFYDDTELAAKAQSAYEKAINLEWRALDPEDATARFELADKIAQFKLQASRRMELIHEGDRILWRQLLKTKKPTPDNWSQLMTRLEQDLPGSTEPLQTFPPDLKDRYEREPLAAYRESSESDRKKLHRIFYIDAALKMILQEADQSGRNGDQIAARLEKQVPEAQSLADHYAALKMNWRLENAKTATRPEIEQLAADFRSRQQPELASQALTNWLQAQESRYRQDGSLGLLQLADEYLLLLRDERKAVMILSEAYKLDSTFNEVTDKLKSMGYTNVGGTWVKANPIVAPVFAASGIVTVGMTVTEVRKSISPVPICRAVTRQGVSEVWTYGESGSRLIIRLQGNRDDPTPRVVEIRNETAAGQQP